MMQLSELVSSFHADPWRWVVVSVLLILALLAILYLFHRPRFRRQPIMTPNEIEFHRRLMKAFPTCQVWPQIPILALLRPDARQNSRRFWKGFRMISNARVDWVIAYDLDVIAIIELDDRTHDARKDARRDRILNSCGYRVLRFDSKNRLDPQQIREVTLKSKPLPGSA
jgi:Protein of unknown function (DUF2726)